MPISTTPAVAIAAGRATVAPEDRADPVAISAANAAPDHAAPEAPAEARVAHAPASARAVTTPAEAAEDRGAPADPEAPAAHAAVTVAPADPGDPGDRAVHVVISSRNRCPRVSRSISSPIPRASIR